MSDQYIGCNHYRCNTCGITFVTFKKKVDRCEVYRGKSNIGCGGYNLVAIPIAAGKTAYHIVIDETAEFTDEQMEMLLKKVRDNSAKSI